MYNHYEDFKKYRTELRRKYFDNDAYKQYRNFYRHIENIYHWSDLWDTTLFNYLLKHPNKLSSMNFLSNEIFNPTLNWIDFFNYNNALQQHPYFEKYLDTHSHDASFWETLNEYKIKLTGHLENNQQLWI